MYFMTIKKSGEWERLRVRVATNRSNIINCWEQIWKHCFLLSSEFPVMHQFSLKLKVDEKERWFCEEFQLALHHLEAEEEKTIVECPFCSVSVLSLSMSLYTSAWLSDFFQRLPWESIGYSKIVIHSYSSLCVWQSYKLYNTSWSPVT